MIPSRLKVPKLHRAPEFNLSPKLHSRPRPRHGSVLLVVIVLLLMLAIMGTSYLLTTRMDRVTSSGDVQNAQIDQIVDGVRDQATGYIVNSLLAYTTSGFQYRPANTPGYNHYDIPVYSTNQLTAGSPPTGDLWLADRAPILSTQYSSTAPPSGLPNPSPLWAAITEPINGAGTNGYGVFEDPTVVAPTNPQWSALNFSVIPATSSLPLYPTFKPITANGTTTAYPALEDTAGNSHIAGDADGDGIADCGLVRLPGVYSDGLTYYAGIRIIDNNSAINVNTAWDNQWDYDIPSGTNFGTYSSPQLNFFPSFFPSAVGLSQLMGNTAAVPVTAMPASTPAALADMQQLEKFRLGLGASPTPTISAVPIDDNQASHAEVNFISDGDVMYHQLSRRVSNAGYLDTLGHRLQSFGDADGAALAYHFGFIDPAAYSALSSNTAGLTSVEDILYYSALYNAPNFPSIPGKGNLYPSTGRSYPAGTSITNWYNGNFTYPSSTPANPNPNLRPLLVTRNGVSNAAPAHSPIIGSLAVANAAMAPYGDRGRWQPTVSYAVGDCVTYSAVPATGAGNQSTLPATSASSIFSGIFFARVANPNAPPTGLATEVLDTTGTSNWARPSYWSPAQPYNKYDVVYTDQYSPGVAVTDQYRFYMAKQATSAIPASAINTNWEVWPFVSTNPAIQTPAAPASALCMKANVNTATFPELFRAYWNVMAAVNGAGALATPFDVPTAVAQPVTGTNAQDIYAGNHFTAAGSGISGNAPMTITLPVPSPNTNTSYHPERMFRSPLRDNPTRPNYATTAMIFDPYQVLLLRAALAAVNTETLRSPYQNVIARQIPLTLNIVDTTNNNTVTSRLPVNVVVYGNQPQPFITEVYAQTDVSNTPAGQNNAGYFAVELYNPYSTDIPLIGPSVANGDYSWQIATINRATQNKTLVTIAKFDPATYSATGTGNTLGLAVVPAGGYLLLENYNPNGGGTAAYRPAASGLPLTGTIANSNLPKLDSPGVSDPNNRANLTPISYPQLNTLYIAALGSAINQEMVILRRRNTTGAPAMPSNSSDGSYQPNDGNPTTNLTAAYDYVPVDSFDFTGLGLGNTTVSPQTAYAAHYVRSNLNWKFVYPGRYDASGTSGMMPQEGTQYAEWDPTPGPGADPWAPPNAPSPGMTLGTSNNSNSPTTNAATGGLATYGNTFEIQLNNPIWAGPNKPTLGGPNYFPFGEFARNGDILEVPYIGAYRIEDTNGNLLDLNSVTMDAAFAEDTDTSDDGTDVEQVGRFCPIIPPPVAGANDLRTPLTQTAAPLAYPVYYWARSLFDYVTVQDPHDDYLPNIDPGAYPAAAATTTVPPYPSPVTNSNSAITANSEAENTESVQGLININTAPLAVLESLPLAVNNTGAVDTVNNPLVAQAIVNYRTTTGPFTSLFDLNNVTDTASPPNYIFQTGNGDLTANTNAPNFSGTSTANEGDLTPASGIHNQFDERYLQINRLSNLITTRSDTFTVYIVVEGWANAGTNTASLVTTRRAAFIVDRNTVTPTSRTVRTVTVPNN